MMRTKLVQRKVGINVLARTKTTLQNDYQFLQRTTVPMMHFQPSLPRLPIPKLEQTTERYLKSLKPLLIPEAYDKSEHIVKKFLSGKGPQLQKLLLEKDKQEKHTSYISKPWSDMYLCDRQPLPINYNPLLILKPHDNAAMNDQRLQTANYIISSLRFMRSLKGQMLEPEVFHLNPKESDTEKYRNIIKMTPSMISTYVSYMFKAYPLDMSQYSGLFGATRIPETDKDRIYRAENSRHIIVVRDGFMYSINVLDNDGNIETPDVILSRVDSLFSRTEEKPNEYSLGYLTAENRDTWATLRHHLQDLGNAENLKLVDSALFCICLDSDTTFDENNLTPFIRNFLFGNAQNRWFDKSLSLLIAKDGTAAVNFEHSWGDGVAVMRYCNDVHKDVTTNPYVQPGTKSTVSEDADKNVKRIDFNLDDKMKNGIKQAKENHERICNGLDINVMRQQGLGKKMCKANKVSPDSVMQLGFQLAQFKLFGKFVSTYESCSTAAFRHGRTETMRPCTIFTKEFCEEVVLKRNSNKSELRGIMNKCSTLHGELTKNAAMGQGFDRHLFGLRYTAKINDIPTPSIFEDPSYGLINYNILSTSTLSSPIIVAGAFGPVVPDGFGLAYGIQDESHGSVVASYSKARNNSDFVQALKESYKIIEGVLTNN